jgi:hypothetical protein
MSNLIKVKRRAAGGATGGITSPAMTWGELFFNEQDNILYYGFGASGTTATPISGAGRFVDFVSTQTIGGSKTWTGNQFCATPTLTDSSTLVATTAFVKGQNYLTANQNITVSGDVSGSGTTGLALTLAATGVTAGTYGAAANQTPTITVDAKGRITSASNITIAFPVTTVFGRTGAVVLAAADVTTALGFTPANTSAAGAANGLATLDATSKLTFSQIPSALLGALSYAGAWNPNTNTPAISSTTTKTAAITSTATSDATAGGNQGTYYKVSVASVAQIVANSVVVTNSTSITGLSSTANLCPGMAIINTTGVTGVVVISSITSSTAVVVSAAVTIAAGTQITFTPYLDGITTFYPGDSVVSDGTSWDKIDGIANEVISVNGVSGVVSLTTASIPESGNLYFTTARASAAAPVQSITGATNAAGVITAIPNTTISGLGTMSTQNSGLVSITGGSITTLATFDGNTIDCGTF